MLEINITIEMIAKSEKYLEFDRSKASRRRIDRYIQGAILYRHYNNEPRIDDAYLIGRSISMILCFRHFSEKN
jgi:hypothetical protein